jgi:RNA polymerase sigma-70 factor (ECF subfamily)
MLARSRALDLLRRRRPAPPAAPGEEPTVWPDLGGALERDEEGARLRTALEALPPEQRHALCLAFYDGLTHEQVAHAQGVPLGTAKTRIRLAMVRLRGLLGEAPEVTAR